MNLTKWLADQNYKSVEYVSLGGKLPDLIGYNEYEVVAFEEKKYVEEISDAIGQCIHYLQEVNKAYIVLPEGEIDKIHPQTLEILRKYGIGLIRKGKNIEIISDAQIFENSVNQILEKIRERNKKISKKSNVKRQFKVVNKQDILDLLSEHPKGLTINDISNSLGSNRQSVSKYILVLQETGQIDCLEDGRAKKCILKRGKR